jgi:formyl-CoA transferase
MKYPLEGIRILEWGIFHAGPGSTAILGDLGAEVVKIEQRGKGDPIRHRSHFGRNSFGLPGNGNLFFEGSNRNKKSISIDLNKEKGKKIVYRLIPKFDAFVTNLRLKTVEKMEMTYPILSRLNHRLIYASVSGYGPNGPDRDRGGFDFQGQARSGVMYSMGQPEMPPLLSQFGLIDQATAIILSQAILTALFMRERTGNGQEIKTSILGAALHLSYFNFLNALWLNQDVPRHHRMDTDPARNYYCCKDGKWFAITLQPGGDWTCFCEAIGHPEWGNDPRFDTLEKRSNEHSSEIVSFLDQIFLTKTRDEWLNIFKEYDLFVCPVNKPTELRDDPQIRENYLDEIESPSLGKVNVPGFPVHFSKARAGTRKTAPGLGENTEEILKTLGGYSEQEIEQLKREEVI